MGVVRPQSGSVILDGCELAGRPSHVIAKHGVQLVHENRRIFGSLNVEENLILAGLTAADRWPLAQVYDIFPHLEERQKSRGTDLSAANSKCCNCASADTEP